MNRIVLHTCKRLCTDFQQAHGLLFIWTYIPYIDYIIYTGSTVRINKLAWKSFALSGLFGAKWFCPNCTTGVFQNSITNIWYVTYQMGHQHKSNELKSKPFQVRSVSWCSSCAGFRIDFLDTWFWWSYTTWINPRRCCSSIERKDYQSTIWWWRCGRGWIKCPS